MNTPISTQSDLTLDGWRFGLISRLADDLAHEIKNPLHSMLINLEVMRRKVEHGAQEAALERGDVVEQEIHRLHGLLEQLLLLLRPLKDGSESSPAGELFGLAGLFEVRTKQARVGWVHEPAPESCLLRHGLENARFALLQLFEIGLAAAIRSGAELRLRGDCSGEEIQLRVWLEGGEALAVSEDTGTAQLLEQAGGLARRAGGRLEMEEGQAGALAAAVLVLPASR